jgi:hypothetical protein
MDRQVSLILCSFIHNPLDPSFGSFFPSIQQQLTVPATKAVTVTALLLHAAAAVLKTMAINFPPLIQLLKLLP